VSYRISKDPFSVFLSKHKDVLVAIRKRKPEAARKAMDLLLTGTQDFLEHETKPKARRAKVVA
jgi:DNA-binding GntR family transcriptional regulator